MDRFQLLRDFLEKFCFEEPKNSTNTNLSNQTQEWTKLHVFKW